MVKVGGKHNAEGFSVYCLLCERHQRYLLGKSFTGMPGYIRTTYCNSLGNRHISIFVDLDPGRIHINPAKPGGNACCDNVLYCYGHEFHLFGE